jgi:hypothetical protein
VTHARQGFVASPEAASRRGFIDLIRRIAALEDAAEAAVSGALGEVAYAQTTSDPAGGITTVSDISGLTVTFTPTVDRRYKVTGVLRASQATAQGIQEMQIRNSGGTTLNKTTATVDTGEIAYHTAHYVWTEATGSALTLKLSLSTTAGTADPFASSVQPAFILVEDIGEEHNLDALLTEGGDIIEGEDGTNLATE